MDKTTYLLRSLFLCIILSLLYSICIFAQNQPSALEKLALEAEMIVTGKVTQLESNWNEKQTRIYTTITINADQFLKGEQSDHTITIKEPGGEVGETGELYTHVPKFSMNEEVLLFVKKDKSNNLRVAGGAKGKLSIITDKNTGSKTINGRQSYNILLKKISKILDKEELKK
ncbi:MAG: hypothetical protein P8184_05825 [Calditrichia bacterium]